MTDVFGSPRGSALAAVLFMVVAAIAGPSAWADCSYPPESYIIPNGAAASKEEMLEAKRSVQQYVGNLQDYIDCIAGQIDEADEESSAAQIEMQTKRHDAAVDQMESVASRFNEQLRLYKERG